MKLSKIKVGDTYRIIRNRINSSFNLDMVATPETMTTKEMKVIDLDSGEFIYIKREEWSDLITEVRVAVNN